MLYTVHSNMYIQIPNQLLINVDSGHENNQMNQLNLVMNHVAYY